MREDAYVLERKNSTLAIQFEHEEEGSGGENPYSGAELVVFPARRGVVDRIPAALSLRAADELKSPVAVP